MKQLLSYGLVAGGSFVTYWFYMKQLGSIPFLLLSLFFFYKVYEELSGRAKKRTHEKNRKQAKKASQKKAQIPT